MSSPESSRSLDLIERLRLMPGLSGIASQTARLRITSHVPELDALLGGGLPCGVTELVGRRSSGRTALIHVMVAAATVRGVPVACVDLPNAFDPDCAAIAGVELAHLLWIRPPDLRIALRSTEYVLEAGGFRLVVLDLDVRSRSRWPPSPAMWMRLGRAAVRSGVAIVTVGEHRSAGTFAVLSLEVARRRSTFTGGEGPCPLFDGFDGMVCLRKSRFEVPGATRIRLSAMTAA